MAIAVDSTKARIVKELARLRMWRDVATESECERETARAHANINALLDLLDAEHSQKVLNHVRKHSQ